MKWKDWQPDKPIMVIQGVAAEPKLGMCSQVWPWVEPSKRLPIDRPFRGKPITVIYSNGIFEDEKTVYVPYALVENAGQLKETVISSGNESSS